MMHTTSPQEERRGPPDEDEVSLSPLSYSHPQHPVVPPSSMLQQEGLGMDDATPLPRPISSRRNLTGQNRMDPERLRRRMEFALLIKILLKILNDADEISLYHQVRLSIATCTKRNRMGDPSFTPLEDVLEAHLWLMVGDTYWEKAVSLQQKYLHRKEALRAARYQVYHPGAPDFNPRSIVPL